MRTSPLPSQGLQGWETSIWVHHPCLRRVPIVGKDQYAYITPGLLGVLMVGKHQYGYITLAFSGSPRLGNINMGTSPLPSQGPHSGERSICVHHPCLLRVPMVGKHQYGYITLAFSGSPRLGNINMGTSPLPSQGPHSGERSICVHHPCLLRVPMVGKHQYGYITLAFLGFP